MHAYDCARVCILSKCILSKCILSLSVRYRASEDLTHYSERCVPVTCDSLADASSWLWDLCRCAAYSRTATCEAVMKAVADKQVGVTSLLLSHTIHTRCVPLIDCNS